MPQIHVLPKCCVVTGLGILVYTVSAESFKKLFIFKACRSPVLYQCYPKKLPRELRIYFLLETTYFRLIIGT